MSNFIGIHITNSGIALSTGQTIAEAPYLSNLFQLVGDNNPVFYDLDSSVASLLFLLNITREQGQKLLEKESLWLSPFSLKYFPKKFFSIDYGSGKEHPFLNFANANQIGFLDLGSQFTADNSLQDAVNKAKEAEATAINVDAILSTKLGLLNSTLISVGTTFLNKFSLNWPTQADVPQRVSELAWLGHYGQWFEAFKLGQFEAWDFDINSCHLFELSKLLDTRKGGWVESKTPPDDALLGIAKGNLDTDAPFHPFVLKVDGGNFTPTGKSPLIITLQALQFLKRWNLGTFQVDEGYWWSPKTKFECYKGAMMFLLNAKRGAFGRERLLIQRIYSSLVGKQLQHSDTKGFGSMFNPLIALTVSTNSSLHVAEACMSCGIIPLAIQADGFITDQSINLPLSTDLGGWRLSTQGKCIIAGTGMIAFEGKDTPAELAIDYTTLKNQIKEDPDASQYSRSAYSPVTLALALQQDWAKLGQIQLIERTLTIGTENKRFYSDKPKTGRDLLGKTYDSTPWDFRELRMLHPVAKNTLTSSEVEAEAEVVE